MSVKQIVQSSLILILLVASLASTSSAHAWSYCGGSYVVQRGDWLSSIARNCGVTLTDLRAANPWTYYNRYIYPGDVLVMPGGTYQDPYGTGGPYTGGPYYGYCGPSADGYGSYWIVCRGDTLGSIARYYGVSWPYLQSRNGIANANVIYAGQIIRP